MQRLRNGGRRDVVACQTCEAVIATKPGCQWKRTVCKIATYNRKSGPCNSLCLYAVDTCTRQTQIKADTSVEARKAARHADVREVADTCLGHSEQGALRRDAERGVKGKTDAASHCARKLVKRYENGLSPVSKHVSPCHAEN